MIIATLLSFTAYITSIKHRFFRAVWLAEIRNLEDKLGLRHMPMYTKEATHPRGKNSWQENISAETCFIRSLGILTFCFSIMNIYNIYRIFLFIDP